jgi:hypothetical protein
MEILDRITKNPGFELWKDTKDMEKITRRAFISQTATLAAGGSALATDVPVPPQPTTAAVDATDKRRETLEVLLKILPRRQVELSGRINAYDKSWEGDFWMNFLNTIGANTRADHQRVAALSAGCICALIRMEDCE